MSNILNLYNQLENFNDIYEQNLINNIIEMTLNEPTKNKKVLSKKGEKELKKVVFNSKKFTMKECPITLTVFNEGDIVTKLPCNHIFDNSGILTWLKEEKANCPVCRMELDSIEEKNNDVLNDISNTLFETNPLSLFSNITIDLSLNSDLLQPYHRDYNIPSFDSISSFEDEDDLFFYNSLQFLENDNNDLSDFDFFRNMTAFDMLDISSNFIQ